MTKSFTFSVLLISFCILLSSCSSLGTQSKLEKDGSLEDQIRSYESRARSFQALANSQSLSSPYSSPHSRSHSALSGENLRMVYLQEASRYRELAERARDQLEKREQERLAPQ